MSDAPALFHRMLESRALPGQPDLAACPARVDVAIVGAGVVGLSIGWRLASRGLRVALFDAGEPGGGTSAAATGMLAAAAEHEAGGEALLALGLESQRLWPTFRAGLETAAACDIDYRTEGTLVVAVGRDEVDRLRARQDLHRRAGLATSWMSGSAARESEPGLRPAVSGAISCPDDHQVDPPRLLGALRHAFLAAGGSLLSHQRVERLDRVAGGIGGVVTGDRVCRAGLTVLATGAAIGGGGLLPAEIRLPIRPLKGQALALRMRRGPLPIERVVWTSEIHLAPKSDGRLVVGATVEEAGFDPAITAGAVYALLEAGRRVLPGLEEMVIDSLWTGFRPTSDDDAPVIGSTRIGGLVVAGGHHRNGYLLAPVTAQAIEQLVLDGAIAGEARRFGIDRFEAAGRPAFGDAA